MIGHTTNKLTEITTIYIYVQMDGWSRDMDSLSDAMVPLDKNGFTAKNQVYNLMQQRWT